MQQSVTDSLPAEGDFCSREALPTAINTWAASRGCAFVVGRSRTTSSGRVVVTFVCDRAGFPRNESATRGRQTTARHTGCQFSILAKEALDKTTWRLVHRQGVEFASHNHSLCTNSTAHPVHRQLSSTDRSTIRNLANAGV